MNVPVRPVRGLAAARAGQAVRTLVLPVAPGLFAALPRPQVCDRLGRGGRLTALVFAAPAEPAAIDARRADVRARSDLPRGRSVSHSAGSRAAPRRRRAAPPGPAPSGQPGRRPQQEPSRPEPGPDDPYDGTVRGVLTRTAELMACCVTSAVMSLVVLGLVFGLVIGVYTLLG